MEDLLAVYQLPWDPLYPVVCNESNKQLVGEVHPPIAAAPGHGRILDHEYVRHGVATLLWRSNLWPERRHVKITERRTRQDRPRFIKAMLDERYPQAVKIRLMMDNPTPTTSPRSRKPSRLRKPVAWPSASKSTTRPSTAAAQHRGNRTERPQRPVPASPHSLRSANATEIGAWQPDRIHRGAPVNWRFTTQHARIELTRLYPSTMP
jgi:hypothetical protein